MDVVIITNVAQSVQHLLPHLREDANAAFTPAQQASCCAQQVACCPEQVACCNMLLQATSCAQQATSCTQLVARNLLRWCKRGITSLVSCIVNDAVV